MYWLRIIRMYIIDINMTSILCVLCGLIKSLLVWR